MNTPQTVFTVVYAVMWGAQAGAFGRWKMFDTGRFFELGNNERQQQTRCRFWWSTLCTAVLPVLYLAVALAALGNPRWDRSHAGRFLIQAIVIALTAVFAYYPLPAFYRLWLWQVQSNCESFYPITFPITLCDPEWKDRFPNLPKEDLGPAQACGNLVFGLLFVAISLVAGLILIRIVNPHLLCC